MIFTLPFWRAAAERAVKSFAYSLTAVLTGGALNVAEVPWRAALEIGAGAALLSVLGSITSSGLTGGGPSLTNAETLQPTPVPGADERLVFPPPAPRQP